MLEDGLSSTTIYEKTQLMAQLSTSVLAIKNDFAEIFHSLQTSKNVE